MGKVALITGASSGIGAELALIHAAHGGSLVLVARRENRLYQLKEELENRFNIEVTCLTKDLSTPNAAEELYAEITSRNIEIDYLVNNAGFGGYGLFYNREPKFHKDLINVNILNLTTLTRLFLPQMLARSQGRIMNVASIAGFLPGPLQAVYFASKAYVLSFSEALANELQKDDVSVTALCPGVTDTEFAIRGNLEGTIAFRNGGMSSATVAAYGYKAMLAGKTLAIPGIRNKILTFFLPRLLPRRVQTMLSRLTMEKGLEFDLSKDKKWNK